VAPPPSFEVGLSQRLPWSCFQPPSLKFRTAGFPQYGFKHQAPVKFSAEPSGLSERLKSDPDIRRPTQPLAPAFGRASATGISASECGAVASDHPTWAQRPSLRLGSHIPTVIAYLASSAGLETFRHFPAELVIGRLLTFKDLPVWSPDLPSFRCTTLQNCRHQRPPGARCVHIPISSAPALAIE
jgi:hypothetical protein